MTKLEKLLLGLVFSIATISCAFLKPAVKSANEAAKIACESMLGAEAEAQGMSVEEFCAIREVIDPFIDQLGAAKNQAAGVSLPPKK
jgi:hypothetical protein